MPRHGSAGTGYSRCTPIAGRCIRFCALLCAALTHPVLQAQTPFDPMLHDTNASAVLLDVTTGRILETFGQPTPPATSPGSTLKPFVLLAALDANTVRESTTVECRGTLTVDDHGHPRNLACTHPRGITVFAARDALAYSCNTYFAQLAERTPAPVLLRTLDAFGIHATIAGESPSSRILLALGLNGTQTTPIQLARAYRLLALRFAEIRDPHQPLSTVRAGLLDSVRFGMADNAAVPGIEIAGKTGTASQPGEPWTHGWFAGIVFRPGGAPARVLAVYVPRGSGTDAAALAQKILAGLPR